MTKHISYIFLVFSCAFLPTMNGQSFWTKSDLSGFRNASEEETLILPEHYIAYELAYDDLKVSLQNAPSEEEWKKGKKGSVINLPMPDGSFEKFEIYDSPVMAPLLAAKYPSIQSYKGRSLDTPGMSVRFDTGPYGFHAAIHTHSEVYYIDPYTRGNTTEYLTYNVVDQLSQIDIPGPICGNVEEELKHSEKGGHSHTRDNGPIPLKVYRFALSCTGEWGSIRGSVENALADMNTGINRINQIYENELAIRLVLIDENDQLINLDSQTDPYILVAEGSDMLNANTNITNLRVGADAYDIGHVYHTPCDVGGIAALGSMCREATKAAAVTCHYTFNLDYMAAAVTAHEIGHQMSAQHTFHNCGGNEQFSNAYEPGSGSTIMSYGGLCGNNNVVTSNEVGDYYHVASLIQIYQHTREGIAGPNCAEYIETSNMEPTATILHENDFYIPDNTYFYLEGQGEDENEEDVLTYSWEQFNIGNLQDGQSTLGSPNGTQPHFRSLPPSLSPVRYFPSPDNILAGNFDRTEVQFDGNHTVNFMFTVRDNNAEAGTAVWEEVQFYVVETPVKFGVTSQSTKETYTVGEEVEVTWNVAGTDLAPISAPTVDILLFTGTHPNFSLSNTTVLAHNVFNSGSCSIIIPNEITERGRIIVRASGRNFFSINARDITIEEATEPTLIVNSDPISYLECDLMNDISFEIISDGFAGAEGNVTYTVLGGLPDGAVATFDPETATVGENTTLTISPEYNPVGMDHEVRIGAITEAMDTFYRTLYLNLKSSNHSALQAVSPEPNIAGVGVSVPFEWTASPNADFYRFELSDSPEFGDTNLDSADGLTETSYETNVFLEKNKVYYWRVTARNYCGEDPNVKTFAFATESLFCVQLSPEEGVLPINISGSGLPTVEAPIQVDIAGNVSDVNVKQWFGEHERNKDLVVSLISPEGKSVILVDRKCEQSDFNCSFDDESSTLVKCPLNNGSTYRPQGSLSDFNGDVLAGEWILRVEDTKSGNGGKLEGVTVEFCSNQVLDNPFVVRNESLTLPFETTEIIAQDLLEVDDNNNSQEELIYTIVDLPSTGTLSFDGTPVLPGDQFTQEEVSDNLLSYTSATQNATTYFSFTVIDGEGGFIGITNFNITVSGSTSVNEEALQNEVSIYPNPVQHLLTIDLSRSSLAYSSYEIINLQGQSILRNKISGSDIMNVDVSLLPNGFYIVNLRSEKNIVSKKIVVN